MDIPQRETTTTTSTPSEQQGQFQPQKFETSQEQMRMGQQGLGQNFQQQPLGQQSFEQQGLGQQPFEQQGLAQQGLAQPGQFAGELPSGEKRTIQLSPGQFPSELPGARAKEWVILPAERLPKDLPPAPPGFKVVQYERDIEVDLAGLNLSQGTTAAPFAAPVSTTVWEPLVCQPTTVCEPLVCQPVSCKPEIHIETATVPPTRLDTQIKDIPGGEQLKAKGPHGERIKTTVRELPGGGERIETTIKEPLTGVTSPEDVVARTIVRDPCGGGTTTVETHSRLSPEHITSTGHHVVGHAEAPRKGKLGHHHHDTGLGGLLKGAFGMKHGEHNPKETM
jgi:hypothetical protein